MARPMQPEHRIKQALAEMSKIRKAQQTLHTLGRYGLKDDDATYIEQNLDRGLMSATASLMLGAEQMAADDRSPELHEELAMLRKADEADRLAMFRRAR